MGSEKGSLIEYPCEFPIKAMGLFEHDIQSLAIEIVARHAPDLDTTSVTCRPSQGNKYISVTITITAINQEQLDAIYYELTACEQIIMAL